jgi:hypothetical protein
MKRSILLHAKRTTCTTSWLVVCMHVLRYFFAVKPAIIDATLFFVLVGLYCSPSPPPQDRHSGLSSKIILLNPSKSESDKKRKNKLTNTQHHTRGDYTYKRWQRDPHALEKDHVCPRLYPPMLNQLEQSRRLEKGQTLLLPSSAAPAPS